MLQNQGTTKIKSSNFPMRIPAEPFKINKSKFIKTFKFISQLKLMEGYHNLNLDNWGKTFIDWFTKCSGSTSVSNWHKFINSPFP